MAKYVEKVKTGDVIDYGGTKKLVISVHPYLIRMQDIESRIISSACVGDLVVAGLETPTPSARFNPFKKRKFKINRVRKKGIY